MKHEDNLNKLNHLLLHTIHTCMYDLCRVKETDRLVIGVSGGADSTAMLHLLSQVHNPTLLNAVYVDHQLRPDETEAEIQLLTNQCAEIGVSFTVCTIDVPAAVKASGRSVEEAARQLRYQQLYTILEKVNANKICVAHTADDQVEEFFLRLIRGTGTAGLSCMKALSENILRPLLTIHKSDLISYLNTHKIRYSNDSSNHDLRYQRNRVRHLLLPFLEKEFHASIGDNVRQVSVILQDEDDFLDQQASRAMDTLVLRDKDRLTIKSRMLSELHLALQRRIIEKVLWSAAVKPSFSTINILCNLAANGERGKEIHLQGGLRALRQADDICLFFPAGRRSHREPVNTAKAFSQLIQCAGTQFIEPLKCLLTISAVQALPSDLQDTLILDADKITFPLTLRPAEPGDTFQPLGLQGRKKVNRYLSDKKIEKMRRADYPVLLSGSQIICIVGLQIDEKFRYDDRTENYLAVHWCQG